VTHQLGTPSAGGAELVVPDDHQPDDWNDDDYPWWVRFLTRFRFAHHGSPSLLDRIDFAFMQRSHLGRTLNVAFTFVTLLPIALLRFIEWAYLDRAGKFLISLFLTPFVIALLNAMPVTSWVVPDDWDWIGSLFHPTPIDAVGLPVDGE
jgi:hypothetical protein